MTSEKIQHAELRLQLASRADFIYYENGKEMFKKGFPFWKEKDGQFHFRSTPSESNRKQQIIWMKQGFASDLAAHKLYIASGEPPVKSKLPPEYKTCAALIEFALKGNYFKMKKDRIENLLVEFFKC